MTSLSGSMLACKVHSNDPAIQCLEQALSRSSSSTIDYTPTLEKAMDDSYHVVYKGAIYILRHISPLHELFRPYEGMLIRASFPDFDNHVAPSMATVEGLYRRSQTLATIYRHISDVQTTFRTEAQVMAIVPPDLCECSLHMALIFTQVALQKTAKNSDDHNLLRYWKIRLLSVRAKLPGFEKDSNQVVTMCREMLALAPKGTVQALYPLQCYVESLLARFDSFHDAADLGESISLLQQCVNIEAYELRNCRVLLCDAHCRLFSSCGGADNLTFALSAIQYFLLAPLWDNEWHTINSQRLEKARALLAMIFQRQPVEQMQPQHGLALLEIYRGMVRLLYRMMEVGIDLHLGLLRLVPAQGLASEAFEHALLLSSPERAVEMLEKSRDVFWTQTLRLRSSFDGLPPHLAERLKSVTPKLESYIHNMYGTVWKGEENRYEQELGILRSTQDEFRLLAEQVRQLEGYGHFMADLFLVARRGRAERPSGHLCNVRNVH
ncbi:hypothetical protein PHLCEN_2v13281 [Hermanssonia centrifuga]|uniref:Uncharacterized protein n=1 Tax=Hermanssonia centrifuga TaxID=98765 RepID=A0A2R6NEM7_9APHY|nr:hypothetical protein PHLCEN_2v13281 [Hermanssonia centrifuga]